MADRRALGSLAGNPELDSWLALRGGRVVVRTGKAELGQGIQTALVAVAADELGVDPGLIEVEGPATGTSPNELITAGSGSVEQSATAVRQACAHARRALLARAADHFGVPAGDLSSGDGTVRTADGRAASYWDLVGDAGFGITINDLAPTVPASERRYANVGLRRVDLPAKVRGEPVFVHDMAAARHARVVRPGWIEHTLAEPADAAVLADVVRQELDVAVDVVVDGSFVAVLGEREGDVVLAAAVVADRLRWLEPPAVAGSPSDPDGMIASVESSALVVEGSATDEQPGPPVSRAGATVVLDARYTKPFLLHASIGPSAAVARFDDTDLEVWTHSQGVELLRPSVAEALDIAVEHVVVRHVDGAGCYGHNGADDAAFDAALVAFHRPGAAVKVQWSRADEHRLEPASPAMVVDLSAGVDAQGRLRVVEPRHLQLRARRPSVAHGTGALRPAGGVVAGDAAPSIVAAAGGGVPQRPVPQRRPAVRRRRATHRQPPRRRLPDPDVFDASLGAFANVFAIESFMDELAHAAGVAPDRFRIAHLVDPRAVEVIEAVVELAGGLVAPGGVDAPGRGLAFARYENIKAYVAVVVELTVDPRDGAIRLRHAWIAADAGEVIDPGGLANQLEGGFVQAASWTLHEELAVEGGRVAIGDWEGYPIMRFSEVPRIETRVLQRTDAPPLGAAEAITGPTPAAIANAVFDATGARLRDLPLRPERVRAALDALEA